jgi:hypothetical protein
MANNSAKIIKSDGTEQILDHCPTLAESQKIVGGYIEKIPIRFSNKTLIVNEDGRIKNLPLNHRASQMFFFPIVGDIIVLEGWKCAK